MTCGIIFFGLCLIVSGMERHAEKVWKSPPPPWAGKFRALAGGTALGLAGVVAAQEYGLSVGAAVWFASLTAAAAAQVLLLAYRPPGCAHLRP